MADKLPGVRSAEDLTERRKELIYCDGYDSTDGVTAFTLDANVQETDVPVFGQDSNITGTVTTSTNVSMTVLENNASSNGILRLLHGMKPAKDPLNSLKLYKPGKMKPVNLLVLRKKVDDSRIVMSRLVTGVQFGAAYPTGGPDDKSQRTFTGKGGIAKELDWLVTCDLIESGGGSAYRLRNTPAQVPGETTGTYAVHIEMIKAPSGDLSSESTDREPVTAVTTTMVNSLGDVDWASCVSACNLNDPNFAHVYYLTSGIDGIPATTSTIAPEGMRGTPA